MAYKKYSDTYGVLDERLRTLGVSIGISNFSGHPLYYVYAMDSLQSVGDYVKGPGKDKAGITLGENLVANDAWVTMLKSFCEKTGLPYHKPQWCLVVDTAY